MRPTTRDRVIASGLIGVGACAIWVALDFRGDGNVYPVGMAGLLILASALKLVRPGTEAEGEGEDHIHWPRFAVLAALTIALFALAESLGFYIVVPVFMFATLKILSRMGLLASLLTTVLFTAAIFVVFDVLLEVPTPAGLLDGLI